MRLRHDRSAFGWGGLLAVFGLAAGLAAASAAQAEDTLRVGKAVEQAFSFVPLDVGMQTGIFKKHGLAIESFNFTGSAKLQQALAADAIDLGLGSGPELAFVAKGAPVKGVAAMAGPPLLFALIVRKDAPIQTVPDLKGRNISVSTVGSLTTWLVRELSRQQGWGNDGINLVALGGDVAQIAAMRTKQVDGANLDIATDYKLVEAGEVRILTRFGGLVHDFILHVIYARDGLIEKNPDQVKRFLAGWFETIAFIRANKAETVRIGKDVQGVSEAIADKVYDELMPMFSDDGKFDPKALATLQRSFVDMGLVTAAPDMSKLYTEKFLPAAAQ